MSKKPRLKNVNCIDSISDFFNDFKGNSLSREFREKFLNIVFNVYDENGPGSLEDIKSEIYVSDKALYTYEFFLELGFHIFDIDDSDLYVPYQLRSQGYKKAYRHTREMFSEMEDGYVMYA